MTSPLHNYFFIFKPEPQYGQEAECAPVHFTSYGLIGPPHFEQVAGNKAALWIGSVGVTIGLVTTGGVESKSVTGGFFFCGFSFSSSNIDPKTNQHPPATKSQGHQSPCVNIKAKMNHQIMPPGKKKCGPCLRLLCLCMSGILLYGYYTF